VHTRPTIQPTRLAVARQECNANYLALACAIFCGRPLGVPLSCRLRLDLAVCKIALTGESETAKRVANGSY
jgi:hypothetical protein